MREGLSRRLGVRSRWSAEAPANPRAANRPGTLPVASSPHLNVPEAIGSEEEDTHSDVKRQTFSLSLHSNSLH